MDEWLHQHGQVLEERVNTNEFGKVLCWVMKGFGLVLILKRSLMLIKHFGFMKMVWFVLKKDLVLTKGLFHLHGKSTWCWPIFIRIVWKWFDYVWMKKASNQQLILFVKVFYFIEKFIDLNDDVKDFENVPWFWSRVLNKKCWLYCGLVLPFNQLKHI